MKRLNRLDRRSIQQNKRAVIVLRYTHHSAGNTLRLWLRRIKGAGELGRDETVGAAAGKVILVVA